MPCSLPERMKKQAKRLSIDKETIRSLASTVLARAAGGNDTKLCTYPVCAPTALTCGYETKTCYY